MSLTNLKESIRNSVVAQSILNKSVLIEPTDPGLMHADPVKTEGKLTKEELIARIMKDLQTLKGLEVSEETKKGSG